MTQPNGPAHTRWLLGMASAALAFTGASIATASDKTDETAEKSEVTIVKVVQAGDQSGGHREMHIITADERCKGAKPTVDESDESKDEDGKVRRSRIVICTRGEETAQALPHLEKARERLAKEDELSQEARGRALAALDREIARLKSQQAPSYSKQ